MGPPQVHKDGQACHHHLGTIYPVLFTHVSTLLSEVKLLRCSIDPNFLQILIGMDQISSSLIHHQPILPSLPHYIQPLIDVHRFCLKKNDNSMVHAYVFREVGAEGAGVSAGICYTESWRLAYIRLCLNKQNNEK